jgi:hypothetical protein
VRWPPPALTPRSDFAILRPGESYRTTIDLADFYDTSKAGQYTITLASPPQHASMSDGRVLKTDCGLPMLVAKHAGAGLECRSRQTGKEARRRHDHRSA